MNEMNMFYEIAESLADPAVRQRIRENPKQYAIDNDFIVADSESEVRVYVNTADTMYIPMMDIQDAGTLDARDLQMVQAAGDGTASTAGTGGSSSTLSCLTSSVGTFTTLSSAGSAGTASGE